MADLVSDGTILTLALSHREQLEGFRGDPHAPLAAVTAVRAVADPWAELRGMRAPGTGLPGVIAVGTRRGPFGKDFAAVHGAGPAVVVDFVDVDWSRWVLTADDPDAVVARLRGTPGPG